MKKLLLFRHWAGAVCLMCAVVFNVQPLQATHLADTKIERAVSSSVITSELSTFEFPAISDITLAGNNIATGIISNTSVRKASKASTSAVNISGSLNVSTLADNSEVVLTGNTNIYMDVNKTLKSITGDYMLTLSGGNILTLDNEGGYAIDVSSVSINSPLRVLASYIAIGAQNGISINANVEATSSNTCIGTLKGDITISANVTATTNHSAAILNKGGNITINSGVINAIGATSGDWAWGIAAKGSITAAEGTTINATGGTAIYAEQSYINFAGKVTATAKGTEGYGIYAKNANVTIAETNIPQSYIAIGAEHNITINGTTVANSTNTCIGTIDGTIVVGADLTATTSSSAALLSRQGRIAIQNGTTTVTGGKSGDWAYAIAASARVSSRAGTTINAFGGTAIYAENGEISLSGITNIEATKNAIYAANATNGNITINGNLTAETTSNTAYAVVGKNITLNGGTMNITSIANAVVANGNMTLSGNITAIATSEKAGAFNTRDGGNLLIKDGSVITGSAAGFGIYAAGNITMQGGSLVARGYTGTAIQSESGYISLTGTINTKGLENAIYAQSASNGNITVNGNLTAETTGDTSYGVVGKTVTLNGGTMNITSVANAVVAYGDMTLSGNITATATSEKAGAFNTRDGGNLLIKDGSVITGSAAGFGIYAAGNITMQGGSLVARGYTGTAIQSESGYISLTGTINTKGLENAIYAQSASNGNITVNGKLTAETTGDTSYGVVGKTVTLNGSKMNIISVANAVVSYGDMTLSGNIIATSTKATSVALNSRDGGSIIFKKGDFEISGAGQAIYSAGSIALNTTLAIITPTNGKIYGNTIADSKNNAATYVHIGYTPKVTQNTISTPTTIKYGEQVRIEGKIKAIGQTTYRLQESADGSTWRTIKSGTIATDEARAGHTIQYKKVFVENGYEAYHQYRIVANHVASGEQDTSVVKKIYFKYPLFKDGLVNAYYSANDVFKYAKPADCKDYKYTSQLPARVEENNDYLNITMPASPLYIDEYTPTYKVDFYDADATLLKTEEVLAGEDATPPSMGGKNAPTNGSQRVSGSTFTGWSKDYTNVHKNLNVFAKYDVYVDLDIDVANHTCNRNEDWKFASWMFTDFENNKTMAMAGDQLTFRASVKTNTPVSVYFQAGTLLSGGEISWTTGTKVGEITGYDVNKLMTFDREVTALVEYYNELPFERKRYYRFYVYGTGTAETVYSEVMEIQMYYPLLVNSDQEVQVVTSEGGFYFNGLRSIIPVQYNETVLILDRQGLKGAGLTMARVNKPAYLIEGYTNEGVHYIVGPGETETLNITTTKKLIVFDGVYGNGYPKQLDFSAQGFGKLNGYYGEVVPCGGSVTMPEDPTEENAIFLGWTSWNPSLYDSIAYLNVPAISDNILGFTANFEYYDPTPQYTVRFYGKDGMTLLDTQTVNEGADATPPAAPAVDGWHFTGWDKPYTTITGDVNITAIYGEDMTVWTVTYKNWDGSSLGSEQVNDGEAAQGVAVTREGYTFVKWRDYITGDDVDMEHITANITVEAVFVETLYTVTYRVDGVETYSVQATHGSPANSIYYPLGTPTKEATEALIYTFSYWTPEVTTITEDVTFDAIFIPTARQYTVQFQNWDHTLLSEQQVAYGMPAVAPSEPTRMGYFFEGWDREFDATMADMTVTAMFRMPYKYTISWLNDDDSLIEQTIVAEGEMPTHADPFKPATEEYTYTFAGWTPDIVPATCDATYTATYSSTKNTYIVTFVDYDSTVLKVDTVEYGQAATPPANPVRENYYFVGWDIDFSFVTEDITVTATYKLTDPTGVDNIYGIEPARKVMIDNRIFILREDKIFTVQGQEVK